MRAVPYNTQYAVELILTHATGVLSCACVRVYVLRMRVCVLCCAALKLLLRVKKKKAGRPKAPDFFPNGGHDSLFN